MEGAKIGSNIGVKVGVKVGIEVLGVWVDTEVGLTVGLVGPEEEGLIDGDGVC